MNPYDALIVSHGQPSAPDPAETVLSTFAKRVQAERPDLHVGAATMAAPGRLEAALTHLKPGAPVYPMFMSEGWFVKTALARRLSEVNSSAHVLPPLGLDPALPALVAKDLPTAPLLLAAHGSASGRKAPEEATRRFAAALEQARPGLAVTVGFLEQAPYIHEVAADAQTCLPFFALLGDHVRHDLPADLAKGGFNGPVLPVIGDIPGVDTLVARALLAACTNR